MNFLFIWLLKLHSKVLVNVLVSIQSCFFKNQWSLMKREILRAPSLLGGRGMEPSMVLRNLSFDLACICVLSTATHAQQGGASQRRGLVLQLTEGPLLCLSTRLSVSWSFLRIRSVSCHPFYAKAKQGLDDTMQAAPICCRHSCHARLALWRGAVSVRECQPSRAKPHPLSCLIISVIWRSLLFSPHIHRRPQNWGFQPLAFRMADLR